MSFGTLEYRSPEPRAPIINRTSVRLILLVMALIAVGVGAVRFFDARTPTPAGPQTTVLSFVDARTAAPIPITIMSRPTYPAADPWKRKITVVSANSIRFQWVDPKVPATVLISSPGYQPLGVIPVSNRPALTIGLWPAPARAAAPATAPSSTTTTTATN
jgi:hypothetical protein